MTLGQAGIYVDQLFMITQESHNSNFFIAYVLGISFRDLPICQSLNVRFWILHNICFDFNFNWEKKFLLVNFDQLKHTKKYFLSFEQLEKIKNRMVCSIQNSTFKLWNISKFSEWNTKDISCVVQVVLCKKVKSFNFSSISFGS